MIEVLSSFGCSPNTFFVSVDIMDAFFAKSPDVLESRDVHLIGVTAMLLASKMEEIVPFKVSTVVDKMAHGKLKRKTVSDCEKKILSVLEFKLLDSPSLFVFVECLLVKLGFHSHYLSEEVFKVVTYISKMLMHDFSILSKFPLKYLAASCLYICFKIVEQVNEKLKTRLYVEKLKLMLNLDEQIFYSSSEKLLDLAKNFEVSFSFAKNLLKFDSFSLDKEESDEAV